MRCPRCKNQSIAGYRDRRICRHRDCFYKVETSIEYRVELLELEKTELLARIVQIEENSRRGFTNE